MGWLHIRGPVSLVFIRRDVRDHAADRLPKLRLLPGQGLALSIGLEYHFEEDCEGRGLERFSEEGSRSILSE